MERIRIAYHGLDPSDALTALVRTRIAHLDETIGRLDGIAVAVEARNHRHRSGERCRVRVEAWLPGAHVVADKKVGGDPYAAVRAAFDALRRRLDALEARRESRQRAHQATLRTIRVLRQ